MDRYLNFDFSLSPEDQNPSLPNESKFENICCWKWDCELQVHIFPFVKIDPILVFPCLNKYFMRCIKILTNSTHILNKFQFYEPILHMLVHIPWSQWQFRGGGGGGGKVILPDFFPIETILV